MFYKSAGHHVDQPQSLASTLEHATARPVARACAAALSRAAQLSAVSAFTPVPVVTQLRHIGKAQVADEVSPRCHDAGVPTHVALLRGINNLGSKKISMAGLREMVTSLGHTDVMTYIQSGNVLFTPLRTGGGAAGALTAAELAAELEHAVAADIGVQARAVVLTCEELSYCVRDNPYPDQTDPRLLHAIFLPDRPGPSMAAWIADAERQVRANGSRDQARMLGHTVYLHTPDGFPRSELRRVLARAGGPTSARVAGTARNWATVTSLLKLCQP